jgi:hypothetical protein
MCRNIQNVVSDALTEMRWQGLFREIYTLHPLNDRCMRVRLEMLEFPETCMEFEIVEEDIVCLLQVKNIKRRDYTDFLDCLVEAL